DGGPVVHLTLDRARHLDRLQLGPEGAREGTLYHAFKTTLGALQNSQRVTSLHVPCPRSYPGRGSARGRANLLVAQGGWRNGRRARFRSVCPKGREGSNPSSPTYWPGLRDDDDWAAGVAGQPSRDGTRDAMPDVLRRPDHERVRVEFLGGRGEFPGRAASPGADVHLHVAG